MFYLNGAAGGRICKFLGGSGGVLEFSRSSTTRFSGSLFSETVSCEINLEFAFSVCIFSGCFSSRFFNSYKIPIHKIKIFMDLLNLPFFKFINKKQRNKKINKKVSTCESYLIYHIAHGNLRPLTRWLSYR